MFDLGIQELIVIFVVALLVFGPKRLPELGRTLGKGILELKKAMEGMKEQIREESDALKAVEDRREPEQKSEDSGAVHPGTEDTQAPEREHENRDAHTAGDGIDTKKQEAGKDDTVNGG